MAERESPTVQKLLKSFIQFRKTGWHDKKIGGYNPSEYKVLAVIYEGANKKETEMKVSEISQILGVTPPTVTQIINNLDKGGLVERTIDPEDRRAVRIKLTLKGIELTENARKAFFEKYLGLVDYLGEEDSEKLADLLNKVHKYFYELKR